MNYIESLQKRYSVKKFNKDKKISPEILRNLLSAGQLSVSSLGLQPYKIFVIESDEMKNKLIPAFRNPSQISTCSHLIVLATKKNVEEKYVEGYFRHITEVREVPMESLDLFRKSIDQYIRSLSEEEEFHWHQKQAYIVLGQMIFAAALEEVDSCPMEGFNENLMNEILGIDSSVETATVTLALGYRAEDDHFQHLKKVRKPEDKLFKFL